MPFMVGSLVAVDPVVLFACAALVALAFQWDGQVWALATPMRRRWTAAMVSVAAAFVYFYLPRGDFWWCIW